MTSPSAFGSLTAPASVANGGAGDIHAKARAAAQEFEAVFLNTLMQPMFAAASDGGPFSGGAANRVWRSMLTDQYARHFAASGGIGLADHVYQSLIAAQEGRRA